MGRTTGTKCLVLLVMAILILSIRLLAYIDDIANAYFHIKYNVKTRSNNYLSYSKKGKDITLLHAIVNVLFAQPINVHRFLQAVDIILVDVIIHVTSGLQSKFSMILSFL